MDDLTTLELYLLECINHYSEEITNLLIRSKRTQLDTRFLNEYMDYVHTYRDILFYVRKLKEMKNDDTHRGEDHPEEA